MLERFPSYVSILAALVVIAFGFIAGRTPYEIAIRLVFVIAIAYFCSAIIRSYLRKRVFNKKDEKSDSTNENISKGFFDSSEF